MGFRANADSRDVAPDENRLDAMLERVRSLPLSHDGAIEEIVDACGLFHEVGPIVLTRVAKPEFLDCYVTVRKEKRGFSEVEREVFGFGHPELGARLAEQWRFPPPICEAIRCQDDPAAARIERSLADAVHCGDWLAAEMHRGLVPFSHPEWPQKRAADVFGMSPPNLAELI